MGILRYLRTFYEDWLGHERRCAVVLKSPQARLPRRATPGAAGYDLHSVESLTLAPQSRALLRTGLFLELPEGYHLEIRPRSGLALKHGITVLNTPGTIDADYRGELMVLLFNSSQEPFEIRLGDRIAQAVLMRHYGLRWEQVESLGPSERAERAFGSTGIGD